MLDKLLGNASEVSPGAAAAELEGVLLPEEKVMTVFKMVRDLFVFSDRRLILVDKQGLTGKKVEYHSIPYKSISHFSVETAGRFDRDAEIKIYVHGRMIERELKKGVDVIGLQRTLAHFITE